jgi:outer membrane receptor protein involved in Fe transport
MRKFGLLGTSAIRSAAFLGLSMAIAAPAYAQSAQSTPQDECDPSDPSYDPNTKNCTQAQEGTPGQTAPGTNPGTAPSDEEPDQMNTDADSGESIVVTGSRIPRPQFEGTIPGAQVTQEQIETRSFTSALEALNDIPLVGAGASPFGTNGAQPGSLGAAFVDLLDLGTNRTLTLVNGRRFVSGNQGTLFVAGNTTGSQVDLSVIPTALISRFDVLTVGGAAAYGSDAIAGVVNAILIDDYDGQQVGGTIGITEQGDGFNYRGTAIVGRNFMNDRANVTVSYERIFDASLTGDRRDFLFQNFLAPTFFGNGGARNPGFTGQVGGPNAFLPAGTDQITQFQAQGTFGGSLLVSPGGTVFRAPLTQTTQGPFSSQAGTTLSTGVTSARGSVAGNAQLIPGTAVAAPLAGCVVTNLTNFCNFAPTGLPAGTAAQQAAFANAVVAQFSPTQSTGTTQAQRNTLATQLLQANRPTPREFFAANPQLDTNLFLGQFITFQQGGLTATPAFLTTASGNPILPNRAVPLFFGRSGNLLTESLCLQPGTTASAGAGPCSDAFQNPSFFNVLRTEQTRDIGNLFAHFDITDNLTVYTENLFARVKTVSPANTIASSNALSGTTGENATLIMNINNPFLDAADRATLIAAGVPATGGQFLLSRTNQDLASDNRSLNPITNDSETYRLVGGVKGDFGLFGQNHTFDASVTFGRNDAKYLRNNVLDTEFALATDAVVNPANGQIVCRVQIDPTTVLGTRGIPRGVNAVDIIRVTGADGTIEQKVVSRVATPEQIAGCVPFNPFGFGQSSEAARAYVTGVTTFENTNKQLFTQASLGGSLFNLPGGPLGYALSADYRRDQILFRVDPELSQTGRTRAAILAQTEGEVENYEAGVELRIPIFGDDFNIPLFQNLEFTPAVRFVKQKGSAPSVRLLNGTIQENETADRGFDRIYSLAGSWRPVRDITFRGNYTRSLRQPSVVELFLGGQPAFNAYTDPCTSTQIAAGLNPTVRTANCIAAAQAAGVTLPDGTPVTTAEQATTFLSTFTNPGNSVQGAFAGSPDLEPEKGRSYTFGVAANPAFIPGLRLSADYINVKVLDQIIPTTLTRALQVCFDSPNFPDTSPQVGVNTCSFFTRGNATSPTGAFIIENNFNSGFINLGALGVEAINMTASYNVPINDWFGSNLGTLELYANAYHLLHYRSSSNGNLNDPTTTFDFAGAPSAPEWEVQGRIRYEHPTGFYGQWTTNWNSSTCTTGISDVCATTEELDILKVPAFAIHDATIGWRFGEKQRFGFQVTVNNILNNQFALPREQAIPQASGGSLDFIGRRFRVSASVRF